MKRFTLIVAGCLMVFGYAAYAQVNELRRPGARASEHAAQHDSENMSAEAMGREMQKMNKMMTKALGDDEQYDARFIDMMIPHHEGAVMMAKDALKHARHQELKDMAGKMIKDQQKEIEIMKKWRQDWYGRAAEKDRDRTGASR